MHFLPNPIPHNFKADTTPKTLNFKGNKLPLFLDMKGGVERGISILPATYPFSPSFSYFKDLKKCILSRGGWALVSKITKL